MRLLANENFPRAAVEALRLVGHEVAWLTTDAPGSSDEEVLARAHREHRLLLTFDKDFGELVLKRGLAASRGVMLFRIPLYKPAELALRIVSVIASRSDWVGHFSVIEPERVRMRPLAP
jgi:predicted nuclease of predicted toxin-antitoxin system